MSDTPRITERAAHPYVGVTERVRLEQLPNAIDNGFAELFAWLTQTGTSPVGAPFIRYIEVDMARSLLVELGIPVMGTPPSNERVRVGVLPAGEYVTLLHRGPYDGLVAANADVQKWGEQHGSRWAMDSPTTWRARIEHYVTDPREEPDPTQYQTEIAYLIDS
jgi:effector-binding domain-containing protein